MRIINAFAMTLRRYTALNHIAQATKAVLEDKQQITQMLSDLNRVDFHHIQVGPLLSLLYYGVFVINN
jgi:regulatory factor X 1/2/3